MCEGNIITRSKRRNHTGGERWTRWLVLSERPNRRTDGVVVVEGIFKDEWPRFFGMGTWFSSSTLLRFLISRLRDAFGVGQIDTGDEGAVVVMMGEDGGGVVDCFCDDNFLLFMVVDKACLVTTGWGGCGRSSGPSRVSLRRCSHG